HLGGGFGRRTISDYVTKAVLLAKNFPGTPVKLIWTREEDMRQGRFRPVGMCRMSAGLDDKGNLVGLAMRISAPSILAYVAPAVVHRGIAQHMGYGSYVAAAAEVSVSDRGRLKIHRLVMGTDCGNMVNPSQVTAQVEGSVAYGLGAALYQECTIKGGRVEQENFDTYQMMLMEDFPKIETVLGPSGGFWGGVGEPTIS